MVKAVSKANADGNSNANSLVLRAGNATDANPNTTPHADSDAVTFMRVSSLAVSCLVAAILGSTSLRAQTDNAVTEVEKVLHAQQDAWNRGDIDGFMNGYWRSDETVFVSGDEVTRGWQKVLDRYKKKYSDRAKMGTLTFANLEITALSNDSAVALGGWSLKRANDQPRGRFTLILRRFTDGWKIIHDHTSAAEK